MKQRSYQPQNIANAMERQSAAIETAKEILRRQGIIDPILLPSDNTIALHMAIDEYRRKHATLVRELLKDHNEPPRPMGPAPIGFQPYKDD